MGTDLQSDVFPFGAVSGRPPRVPTGEARAFVLGAYPSAFHVRWVLPAWAQQQIGRTHVAFVPSPRVKARTDTPEHAFAVALSLLAPYTIQVDGEAPHRGVEWGEVPDDAIP